MGAAVVVISGSVELQPLQLSGNPVYSGVVGTN